MNLKLFSILVQASIVICTNHSIAVPESKVETGQRQLSHETQCDEYKDCYNCTYTAGVCMWAANAAQSHQSSNIFERHDYDGYCIPTGKRPYEDASKSINDYMMVCADSLKLCQKDVIKKQSTFIEMTKRESKHSSIKRQDQVILNMQPRYTRPITDENPFGSNIPSNYFCSFAFQLDPALVYEVTIIRRLPERIPKESVNLKLLGYFGQSALSRTCRNGEVGCYSSSSQYISNEFLWRHGEGLTVQGKKPLNIDEPVVQRKMVQHVSGSTSMFVFTRNVYETDSATFSIIVEQYLPDTSATVAVYTTFITVFLILSCCIVALCLQICIKDKWGHTQCIQRNKVLNYFFGQDLAQIRRRQEVQLVPRHSQVLPSEALAQQESETISRYLRRLQRIIRPIQNEDTVYTQRVILRIADARHRALQEFLGKLEGGEIYKIESELSIENEQGRRDSTLSKTSSSLMTMISNPFRKKNLIYFDQKFVNNDKYDQHECTICMETFVDGEHIVRIPTCQHFFHPNCIKGWFSSANQIAAHTNTGERRCPLCNIGLNYDTSSSEEDQI